MCWYRPTARLAPQSVPCQDQETNAFTARPDQASRLLSAVSMRATLLLTLSLLCLTACVVGPEESSTSKSNATCTKSTVATEVFAPRCGGCHGVSAPASMLDLMSPMVGVRLQSNANCTNEVVVVAGNPASSYLMKKLTSATPTCGVQMPKESTPLSADELNCIEDWILDLSPTTTGGGSGSEGGW